VEARGTVEQVGIAEVTDQAQGPAIAEEAVEIASATGASRPGLAGVREATPLGAEPVAARLAPAARAGPPAWVLVVAAVAVAAAGGGGRQA
jgi:hypothetical protein